MDNLEPANETDLSADAKVACLRCGYDLRGFGAEAACPECGLGVGRSLAKRERLEDCPPAWVRRLSVGAWVLTAAMAWAGVEWIVWVGMPGEAYGAVSSVLTWQAPWLAGDEVPVIAGLVVQLVGVWLVTGREPGKPPGRGLRFWAWAWRAGTVVGLLECALVMYQRLVGTPYLYEWILWVTLHGLLMAASAICPAVGFWRLKWLATRIGRPKLAEYAGIVGVGLSALLMQRALLLLQWPIQSTFFVYSVSGYVYVPDWVVPAEVVIPTAVLAGIAVWARVQKRRKWVRVGLWGAAIWAAVSCLAIAEADRDYTRRLWSTVLARGLPIAAGLVFYAWGLFLLARMGAKFWTAAQDAQQAWREADASLSAHDRAQGGQSPDPIVGLENRSAD